MSNQQTYTRFLPAQRIEHLLLLASFTTLALTGLPQKYAGNAIAEGVIALFGGIEKIRTVHHIAAIVFLLEIVYHAVVVAYKVFVRRTEMSMLPGLRDITDGIDVLRYNLGLTKEHPKLPRYSFDEKVEYWALIWGGVIMAFTGFMLWNPITTARALPGEVIPAAKAAHGAEAVLAVLAILIWHTYNVHFKHFNKSMFTGKMTLHDMEQEHGDELARLESGKVRPLPSPEGVKRRERLFLPVALLSTIILVGGVYWFATAETTAITLVPQTPMPVFVPLTPTPVTTPEGGIDNGKIGAPIPHEIAGREQCDTCHALNGAKPYPADHVGRPNESCTICHRTGPQSPLETSVVSNTTTPAAAPKPIPHALAGKQACNACHAPDSSIKPAPADHAGRAENTCTACHQPAGEGTTTPAATFTAAATTAVTSTAGTALAGSATPAGPKPIPHSLEGKQECNACHAPDSSIKPAPADHAGRANSTCTACHKPAETASATPAATSTPAQGPAPAATPPDIRHSITDPTFKPCLDCHAAGKMKPFPVDHQSFTIDSCTACHKPAVQ